MADRRAGNGLRRPWTDRRAPAAVRDPEICAQAARAYAAWSGRAVPAGTAPIAGVVRAGGLYFVVGRDIETAGEFILVAVLDAQFRVLMMVTT